MLRRRYLTFSDTPEITGEGSIRKVDADDPTRGLAGAVIKITGVDNDFTGTYVTGAGGYLTDVPWKDMPLGSYTAEEVTPPEGYTKSPDVNKTKQTFVWDGKTDIALVFENDAKVMKKNAFTGKIKPRGSWSERTVRCVRAADVATVMGEAGWLVRELQCMETIRWGNDDTEYYIIYEKEGGK